MPREYENAHCEREAPNPFAGNPLSVRAKLRPRRAERQQGVEQGGAALEHGRLAERARRCEGKAPRAPPAPRDARGPRRHHEQPLSRSGPKRRRLPRKAARRPRRSLYASQTQTPHAPHPLIGRKTLTGETRTRREEEDEGEGGGVNFGEIISEYLGCYSFLD